MKRPIMIFEMTNDYEIILPLMVSCILASLVSRHALQMSIYQRQLKDKGILLARGKVQNIMHTLVVAEAMNTNVTTISERCTLAQLHPIIEESNEVTFPLHDENNDLVGVLSLEDIRPVMFEEALEDLVVAGELGTREVVTITPKHTLADAMEFMANRAFDQLIVVGSDNPKKVVGLLSRRSILMAYQNAIQKLQLTMD